MAVKKLLLAAFVACIFLLYFLGGGDKYLDIHLYQDLFERSPLMTASIFFLVFLIGTSFALPVFMLATFLHSTFTLSTNRSFLYGSC